METKPPKVLPQFTDADAASYSNGDGDSTSVGDEGLGQDANVESTGEHNSEGTGDELFNSLKQVEMATPPKIQLQDSHQFLNKISSQIFICHLM